MAQLTRPVEPFGEVNVYRRTDGDLDIVATILMTPDVEGARTGLALDTSASMRKWYGDTGVKSPLLAGARVAPNIVEVVARKMAAFLTHFSADGRVSLLYWACGHDGSRVEEIGRPTEAEAHRLKIAGPSKHPWGRGTRLLPPVRYFVETAFATAPWSIAVLVTDGIIEDLAAVKDYCLDLGRQIAAGRRPPVKFVLLGVGEEIDEAQMEELDDMFNGTELRDPKGEAIDLWDHKLAREMLALEEIFAEVVAEDSVVAPRGRVLGPDGDVARDYTDGLPALLRFTLPAGADAFTLEFSGNQVIQDIREGVARV
jgi:hypothetical protein